MKRKTVGFIFALLMLEVFLYGCGGGGGSHSNPAAPNNTGLARVSGKIVDSANNPVADVKVRLALTSNSLVDSLPNEIKNTLRLSTTDNSTEFTTTTDKDGQYTFENVPYGRYSLSARASDNGSGVLRFVDISGTDTTLSDEPLRPFGFVTGTVTDGKNAIYGARVYISDNEGNPIKNNENGYNSFTNSDGSFTLSYIPIETPSSFTASLEGYEPVTASFTISATDTDLKHSCGSIELKAATTQVSSYTIPVSVGADSGVEINKPVYVIAQNSYNHVFFNVIEGEKVACYLKIPESGDYKLFAIDSNGLRADYPETIDVASTQISENLTSDPITLQFAGSSSEDEGKTVVVQKIALPTDSINENTLNYYNGFVSCTAGYQNKFSFRSVDGSTWTENYSIKNSDGNEMTDAIICSICGNYAVYYTEIKNTSEKMIGCSFHSVDATSNEDLELFDVSNEKGFNFYGGGQQSSFIPNEFTGISYSDLNESGCDVYHCYAISNEEKEMDHTEEKKLVYALKMAKGKDGNCYVAALYSDSSCFLKIYNASDETTNAEAIITDPEFGPDTLDSFQVFKDADGKILFYVEGPNISCLYDKNNKNRISKSQTSNLKGCYIDSNNNMYRYNSDTDAKSVIKTKYSNSENILDSSNDSSKVIASYTVPTSSGSVSVHGDGILGFEETADQLTIYVY